MTTTRPHAIIIGAGFTGCAVAHDLALRGFDVTVIERGDIAFRIPYSVAREPRHAIRNTHAGVSSNECR